MHSPAKILHYRYTRTPINRYFCREKHYLQCFRRGSGSWQKLYCRLIQAICSTGCDGSSGFFLILIWHASWRLRHQRFRKYGEAILHWDRHFYSECWYWPMPNSTTFHCWSKIPEPCGDIDGVNHFNDHSLKKSSDSVILRGADNAKSVREI